MGSNGKRLGWVQMGRDWDGFKWGRDWDGFKWGVVKVGSNGEGLGWVQMGRDWCGSQVCGVNREYFGGIELGVNG